MKIRVYIIWNTNRKVPFLIHLRGLISFYDLPFLKYDNLANLAIFFNRRHFWHFLMKIMVYLISNTNTKVLFLIHLRGHTSFYDVPFLRYGIWSIRHFFCQNGWFLANDQKWKRESSIFLITYTHIYEIWTKTPSTITCIRDQHQLLEYM